MPEEDMARKHIGHKELVRFAQERVNLPRKDAKEYREQAHRLREKLEDYLNENPEFELRKILLSGSLRKGTALRSLNDIDMACYISGVDSNIEAKELLKYLAEKLLKAFPNFSPEQIQPKTYSLTVSFRGSGLDIDVVPVLYNDDPEWYGELISQEDGSRLMTNIPLHLEFIKKRKQMQPEHFAQVVRLVKFWAQKLKQENKNFRFKSFMIEMILSHLCDQEYNLSDYPDALQHFFTYVAASNMREKIVFTDYYGRETVGSFAEPVQIIDPVNAENNVACLYTDEDADGIVSAALDAGDAIDAALMAPTKQETIVYWRRVFGPSFQA